MALTTIYPNGKRTINVPATQSIAISNYGGGIASIYYLIENANRPAAFQLQQILENAGVVLGAFATGKTVKIEAGGSTVVFDVGASPDTGIGDADTLGGQPASYYAEDAAVVHLAGTGTETITGDKNFTGSCTINSNTIWTQGNDGAGSGLDADTIDGVQNSQLAHLAGTETFTGQKFFGDADTYIGSNSTGDVRLNFYDNNSGAYRSITWVNSGNSWYVEDNSSANQLLWHGGNTLLHYMSQGAPTAQTTDDTLTAEELNSRIVTVNQGAAGTSTQTLPLATAMDSYFTGVSNNFGFEFSVINISTNAAEDCTVATNTGWTLVGSMIIESFDADRARSSGRFFASKTGTGAWTLYRIA